MQKVSIHRSQIDTCATLDLSVEYQLNDKQFFTVGIKLTHVQP